MKLFADDTNLFISGIDICALNNKCNYCIETLNQWFKVNRLKFKANRLHMNVDKTNIMVFPKTKSRHLCKIK